MNKTLLAAVIAATAIGVAAPAAIAQPYGYARGYHHFHRGFGYGPYGRGPYGYGRPGFRHHWRPRAWCYRHPGAC